MNNPSRATGRTAAKSGFGVWVVSLFPQWVTPNHLTFLRLSLSLFILAWGLLGGGLGIVILLGLIAGFSDLLDGALARQRGMVTELGAFLDPLGDKLFALVLVVIIWQRELVDHWLLLCLLVTEIHTVLIPLLVLIGRVRKAMPLWPPTKVAPNRWGKLKTGWLATALGLVVVGAWAGQGWLVYFAVWNIWVGLGLGLLGEIKYLSDWRRGAYR